MESNGIESGPSLPRDRLSGGELLDCSDDLVGAVLTAATTVHKTLGPGLLESVYERALVVELGLAGLSVAHQVEIPARYRGVDVGSAFRADIIAEGRLLLEIKAVEAFSPLHLAQVITYLKLTGLKRGFLINFNTRLLKDGIKRVSI